jgi:hypothetical protein
VKATRTAWLLVALAGCSATAVSAQRKLNERRALNGDASIRILNATGAVRVTGWDRDSISVTGVVYDDHERLGLGGNRSSVKLAIWDPEATEKRPSMLEVRVPARATVWVKTASALIEVSGVDGSMDLSSVSGSVRIGGRPRDLNVESMGGDIVADVAAPVARLRTASGGIRVAGAIDDLTMTTVSGLLSVASSPLLRARVESITGAIAFNGLVARGGHLEFLSHSGPIEVFLPGDISSDFAISTFAGKLRNQFGSKQMMMRSDLRGQELNFTTRSGGARISVRTFSGDITLARGKR